MNYYNVLVSDTPISAEQLNEQSNKGWELVTIIMWKGRFYAYFRHRDY